MSPLTRLVFWQCVSEAVRKYSDLRLYGSFSTGTFHYIPSLGVSFSDVDTVLEGASLDERMWVARDVAKGIYCETGARLPVSVRAKLIHTQSIPQSLTRHIAYFELLYKATQAPLSVARRKYLGAKYVLRSLAPTLFFYTPFHFDAKSSKLSESLYFMMLRYKTGHSTTMDQVSMRHAIRLSDVRRWPTVWAIVRGDPIRATAERELQQSKYQFRWHRDIYSDLMYKLASHGEA